MWNRKDTQEMEIVFGLGGGEISKRKRGGGRTWHGMLYYDGAPDYAERENEDAAAAHFNCNAMDCELRTAIAYEMFGQVDTPRGWVRLNRYNSSGEASCWCDDGADQDTGKGCKICDGTGLVYVGDGWGEVVFARKVF